MTNHTNYRYSRAINRARKIYALQVRQHTKQGHGSHIDTGLPELTDKVHCVIRRAWYDLEGYSRNNAGGACLFTSSWDNLFSKVHYLKALAIVIEKQTPFSSAYWELNRRLLIARVERNDEALLDIISAATELRDSHAIRFYRMGQALIDALYCESMLHLLELAESRTTNETRIGYTSPQLTDRIIEHYPALLSFFNQSFETTRNDDDQNFPVYSLPLARIIKMIDDRFSSACFQHRQQYLQHIQSLNRDNTMPLSANERMAVADVLCR
ncbi:hypothetical protein MNBD_GAMMA15-405 [hydrothermal vent metagenome]|uniref:Uncharacterized protein n=1 Tax=hydrothermal vent metagenome TaxID=652676 RepID=A0A3B0Y7U3_9ZZZZ